ncbi:hypothetical protein [Nocardioides panaciterrulae]|uniref:Uncharacterized protein n=1 Tax=Nocardioides panaciterrulae TaxID=661492 RepID=A0A7Y9JC37_9ACTN|nr:hypothetical protein [Nocardioides panaciterrulae]NYD43600.1 hypothetical protein [Nocardioides panaciterrulae]
MYDETYAGDYPWWRHDPAYEVGALTDRTVLDRLTHLVLVDGRLVDVWTEPVRGTRWQPHADRFDAERRPPAPPPTPRWQRALDWLAGVCGGPAAVRALDAEPLSDDGWAPPPDLEPGDHGRLEAAHDLLAAVAERWFSPEDLVAFRRALLRLWQEDPDTVRHAPTAAHLAGGICWAVGKANGCFHPQGGLRIGLLKDALDLHPSPSTYGAVVRRALVGYRSCGEDQRSRPDGAPTLLPLGRADLLTSTTRAQLVAVRRRAEAARDAEARAA